MQRVRSRGGATGDAGFGAGGTYPEDEKKPKSGINAAQAGLQKFAGILQGITGIVQAAGQGLGAQISAVGALISQFNPGVGGIISAAGGLIGAVKELFGGKKRLKTDTKAEDGYFNVKFPTDSTYSLAGNPREALLGGRGLTSGPGTVSFKHEFEINDGAFKEALRHTMSSLLREARYGH